MAQPSMPLSSRDINCITPVKIEGKTGYKFVVAQTYSIAQDAENPHSLPIDKLDDRSSSSFDMDISTSPPKPNIQHYPSPAQSSSKSPLKSPRKQHSHSEIPPETSIPLTEYALRENEGLTRAIHMLECERSESIEHDADDDTTSTVEGPQGYPGMDDTDFTAFSAVPNADVTLFAQTERSPDRSTFDSPAKSADRTQDPDHLSTPQRTGNFSLITPEQDSFDECSPSPTPRRKKSSHEGDTNLILDFTEQFSAFAQSSYRSPNRSNRSSPKKSQTHPNLASYISGCRTPSPNKRQTMLSETRHHPNLLDFDLPPAPTPRSIPSITARELESLKSSFLSQVSSLRATLSGKEAEVSSLKDAVTDAERRVGEALEEIREERGRKESLQAEKLDWESRDKEMQNVLRNVKEVNIETNRERDQLQQKLDESERRREEAEARTIEAHSKIAGLKASAPTAANRDETPNGNNAFSSIDAAVNKVARDLHEAYRRKHEEKVAAVKNSYRARWEHRVHELEIRIEDLGRENEELRLGRDATMSSVFAGNLPISLEKGEDQIKQNTAETQRIQEAEARLLALEAELSTTKHENTNLLTQLEKERLEMADLVAATEEMMQLSLHPFPPLEASQPAFNTVNLRGSTSRSLKATVSAPGESRIGRMAGGGRGFGLDGGSRSGIMGNIERMGRRGVD